MCSYKKCQYICAYHLITHAATATQPKKAIKSSISTVFSLMKKKFKKKSTNVRTFQKLAVSLLLQNKKYYTALTNNRYGTALPFWAIQKYASPTLFCRLLLVSSC